jgi:anti-sigma B factor antagonist
MKVTLRSNGNTRIVDVAGGVDLKTSPEFRRVLFEALGEGSKAALNLAAITFIDSSGIAVLLEALLESQRLQSQFVLFGMNAAVCEVFKITHVARIFQVADTEEQAVGAESSYAEARALNAGNAP